MEDGQSACAGLAHQQQPPSWPLQARLDDEMEYFTELALQECERWIQVVTRKKFKYEDDPRASLEDGILLCELLNCIRPGTVRKINRLPSPIAGLDNINVFLQACQTRFGLKDSQLFHSCDLEDLSTRAVADSEDQLKHEADRRLRNVAITIFWFGKTIRKWYEGPQLDLSSFTDLVGGSSRASSQISTPLVTSPAPSVESIPHQAKGYRESVDSSRRSSAYSSLTSGYHSEGPKRFSGTSDTFSENVGHAKRPWDDSSESLNSNHTQSSSGSFVSSAKAVSPSAVVPLQDSCTDREESKPEDMPGVYDQGKPRYDGQPPAAARYSASLDDTYQYQATDDNQDTSSMEEYNRFRSSEVTPANGKGEAEMYGQTGYRRVSSTTGVPNPAPPSRNPLQFIKVESAPLASQAREVIEVMDKQKEVKNIVQIEDADWHSNLSNWKSKMRRKSAGSYIRAQEADEVKKDQEEQDLSQTRRKNKTFKEMMNEKGKRQSGSYTIYPYEDKEETEANSVKKDASSLSRSDGGGSDEETLTAFGFQKADVRQKSKSLDRSAFHEQKEADMLWLSREENTYSSTSTSKSSMRGEAGQPSQDDDAQWPASKQDYDLSGAGDRDLSKDAASKLDDYYRVSRQSDSSLSGPAPDENRNRAKTNPVTDRSWSKTSAAQSSYTSGDKVGSGDPVSTGQRSGHGEEPLQAGWRSRGDQPDGVSLPSLPSSDSLQYDISQLERITSPRSKGGHRAWSWEVNSKSMEEREVVKQGQRAPWSAAPSSQRTVRDAPVSRAPGSSAPSSQRTVRDAPVSRTPGSSAPSSQRTVRDAPVSRAPGSSAPSSQRMVRDAPVSRDVAPKQDRTPSVTTTTTTKSFSSFTKVVREEPSRDSNSGFRSARDKFEKSPSPEEKRSSFAVNNRDNKRITGPTPEEKRSSYTRRSPDSTPTAGQARKWNSAQTGDKKNAGPPQKTGQTDGVETLWRSFAVAGHPQDSDERPERENDATAVPKNYIEKTIKINQKPNHSKGFGFTIKGGREFSSPIVVEKVILDLNDPCGGGADVCELMPGDEVLAINGAEVAKHYHDSVQLVINQAVRTGHIQLHIRRTFSKSRLPSMDAEELQFDEEAKLLKMEQRSSEFKVVPTSPTALSEFKVVPTSPTALRPDRPQAPPPATPKSWYSPSAPVERPHAPPPTTPQSWDSPSQEMDRPHQAPQSISRSSLTGPPVQARVPSPQLAETPSRKEETQLAETAESFTSDDEQLEREIMEQLEREEQEEREAEQQQQQQQHTPGSPRWTKGASEREDIPERPATPEPEEPPPPPLPTAPPPVPNWSTFPARGPLDDDDLGFLDANDLLPDTDIRFADEDDKSSSSPSPHKGDSDSDSKLSILRRKSEFLGLKMEDTEEYRKVKEEQEIQKMEEKEWKKVESQLQTPVSSHLRSNEVLEQLSKPQPKTLPPWQDPPTRDTDYNQNKSLYQQEDVDSQKNSIDSYYELEEKERQIIENLEREEEERQNQEEEEKRREIEELKRRVGEQELERQAWSVQREAAWPKGQRSKKAKEQMRSWRSMEYLRPSTLSRVVEIDIEAKASRDMETLLRSRPPKPAIQSSYRFFDLKKEREKMEKWGEEQERLRKEKFQREQDCLRLKMEQDMARVREIEAENQKEEEKLLEKELAHQRELEELKKKKDVERRKRLQLAEETARQDRLSATAEKEMRSADWSTVLAERWEEERQLEDRERERQRMEAERQRSLREEQRLKHELADKLRQEEVRTKVEQEKRKMEDQKRKQIDRELETIRLLEEQRMASDMERRKREEMEAQALKDKEEKLRQMEEQIKREAAKLKQEREELLKERQERQMLWDLQPEKVESTKAPRQDTSYGRDGLDQPAYSTGEVQLSYTARSAPTAELEYVYKPDHSPPERLEASPQMDWGVLDTRAVNTDKLDTFDMRQVPSEESLTMDGGDVFSYSPGAARKPAKKEPAIAPKPSIKTELTSSRRDMMDMNRKPKGDVPGSNQNAPTSSPVPSQSLGYDRGQADMTRPMTRDEVMAQNRKAFLTNRDSALDPSPDPSVSLVQEPGVQGMSRRSLHSLGASPRPRYTDSHSWIRSEDDRKSRDDPYKQKRSEIMQQNIGSMSEHWVVEEAERRRLAEQTGKERLAKLQNRQEMMQLQYQQEQLQQQQQQQQQQPHFQDYRDPLPRPSPPRVLPPQVPGAGGYGAGEKRPSPPKSAYSYSQKHTAMSTFKAPPTHVTEVDRPDNSSYRPNRPIPNDIKQTLMERVYSPRGTPRGSQSPPSPHYAYPNNVSGSPSSQQLYPQQQSPYYSQSPRTSQYSDVDAPFSYGQSDAYTGQQGGSPDQHPYSHHRHPHPAQHHHHQQQQQQQQQQQPSTYYSEPYRPPSYSSTQGSERAPPVPPKPPRLLSSSSEESHGAEQVVSVSGTQRCSSCDHELGHGAAMVIESLNLYYHVECFRCCVCQVRLSNGQLGADVRVRVSKLHCQNCYSNDEVGLKYSKV